MIGGFFFAGSYIAKAALLTPTSALAAAIAIGGSPTAVIGILLARRAGKHHRDYYDNQIRHGGILMRVCRRDKERDDLAVSILSDIRAATFTSTVVANDGVRSGRAGDAVLEPGCAAAWLWWRFL